MTIRQLSAITLTLLLAVTATAGDYAKYYNDLPGFAGTTPWVLKDFRSPRRALNGIQDDFNRKGVISDKGEKKLAFFVLQDWYSE